MFIKKEIAITQVDLQDILISTPTEKLRDEFFSRDADLLIDHLTEIQQLRLLQNLLKDISISPEMEEELKFQMRRRDLSTFDNLTLYDKSKHLLEEYASYHVLETFAQLLRDQNHDS